MALPVVQQIAIIRPGETVVLPANIVIDSFMQDGVITVISSCNNLPTPELYECYQLHWALTKSIDDTQVLETDTATFGSFFVGGTEYPIGGGLASGSPLDIHDLLELSVPQTVIKIFSVKKNTLDDIEEYWMRFKSVPSLLSSIEMSLIGNGFDAAYVKPVAADCECLVDEGNDSEVVCDSAELITI